MTSVDQNCVINENVVSIFGDCQEKLNLIKDRSIQTVIIDPPYNIGKDSWDFISNYIDWLTNIINILASKMKRNGNMFIFHNDMEQIAELMVNVKQNTELKFRQMIVWNKRFELSKKKGYMDGFIVKNKLHNWNKMAEYILFYNFDNFETIRLIRKQKKITQTTITNEILSKRGRMTGWYSNIETGKSHPTVETMKPITKHLGIEYDEVVPRYINKKTHHSVWDYDMAKRSKIHVTPKPIDLLINIIEHTTYEGDIVLDCFAGSGTLVDACLNTNRKCIVIEKDKKYYNHINTRVFTPKENKK